MEDKLEESMSSICFRDTLTRKCVEIAPPPALIKIYNCGITVSDYAHIGHARNSLFCDTIIRFLQWRGYSTKYVSNITDIQDKITTKAESLGMPPDKVAEFYLSAWQKDVNWLNILKPDIVARASNHIDEIIVSIEKIIKSGHAYCHNGWVYFDVSSYPNYGELSRNSRQDMLKTISEKRRNERAIPTPHDDLDFTLWQPTTDSSPRWNSPWGYGRPGKHIECSAIINKYFDKDIDIHTGGTDLLFPHHDSEIAQSQTAWGNLAVAKVWLHNDEVQIDGKKMAKSAGNAIYLRDIKAKYSPNTIRLLMLQTHYREKIQYSEKHMEIAREQLDDLIKIKRNLEMEQNKETIEIGVRDNILNEFSQAFENDLDTPRALQIFMEFASNYKKYPSNSDSSQIPVSSLMEELTDVLGLKYE